MEAEPKIIDLIDIASHAITGQADKNADFVRGSDYESLIGPPAVIWTREDRRDQDIFDSTKFHTAKNQELTDLVQERYGITRYIDTNGTGFAVLSRPTIGGGAGTIWKGTRISVLGGSTKTYRTIEDTIVSSGSFQVKLDIEALVPGPGTAVIATSSIRLDDLPWDSSWTVESINCTDGVDFESAQDLIARVRQTRADQRVGQVKSIENVCKLAGAANAYVFRSNYGGDAIDGGLNVVYVCDLGFATPPGLVKACFLALRDARVLGDHMQVLPMAKVIINPLIDIYLATDPAFNDIERLYQIHRESVIEYLGGTSGGFSFTRNGILSALIRQTPEVQHVTIVTPASDVNILVSGHFPPILNRYVVGTVALRYHGPS